MELIKHFNKKRTKKLSLSAKGNLTKLPKQAGKDFNPNLLTTNDSKKIPKIRLIYASITKPNNRLHQINQTCSVSSQFEIPCDMGIEDALKVVSYLLDKVNKENQYDTMSESDFIKLGKYLEEYGFYEIQGKGYFNVDTNNSTLAKVNSSASFECEAVDGVVDLFIVKKNFNLFKKTSLYKRYFNWYDSSIKEEDIKNIYDNIHKKYLSSYNKCL